MIPLWFIKLAIIFLLGIPLICGLLGLLIAAIVLQDRENKQKESLCDE